MSNTLIFIRHAKTKVDKQIPIEKWVLTPEGEIQARQIAGQGTFDKVDILISSDEDKAYLTLKPLANKLQKEIIRVPDLGEIKRPNSEKLTLQQYEDLKVKIFKDLDYSEQGWETSNHALKRFKEAVSQIDKKYKNKNILIAAHGTVLTLYFASIQDKMHVLFSRWGRMEFGGFGIVKDGKVVKDII